MLSLLIFVGEAVRDAFDPRKNTTKLPSLPNGEQAHLHQDSLINNDNLLAVHDLSVAFHQSGVAHLAVKGVSFHLNKGETLAIVGESGSGKSVTALSILQLLPYPLASHPTGNIYFRQQALLGASPAMIRNIRGNRISIIFQEPMTSLNPLHTIRQQIGEVLFLHKKMSVAQAHTRILELLALVGLPDAEKRLNAYPHQLSGGQRQRVMIAMALANEPDILIADEPTTALDVTIQAQILQLLKQLQQNLQMAMLFITHDLSIVRKFADRVCVMQQGELVEAAETENFFANPQHPYSQRLLNAKPSGKAIAMLPNAPEILSAEQIKVWFPLKQGILQRTTDYIKAVDGVSLRVKAGQTLGIVGESGSGKTTLGLALLRLEKSQGIIRFQNNEIQGLSTAELRPLRCAMQIVFQDPFSSLSPRLSIGQIIGEGLEVHQIGGNVAEREQLIIKVLQEVGLDPDTRHRYPHEFSGGQRQRVAIARAMVLKPKLVILDEPTSALDRSVQAQIIDLLRDLQARYQLAYIFISHDLAVIRALSDEIMVMKAGQVVEQGATNTIFTHPQQPYTKALIAAAFDLEAV
ncbi:dipeptide ABC transporter ATP-binding protein [Beggiatoa leptomitoformis]|uniref:Dipeptide ABC transporter ATP-binding protein n=1 Tax=Beggiatoa leptomitoformis TaxID=288004 RepID=A0A2N9YJU0_9GAMM|nr:dipeptide ABC transporter ATP-binding protein [Beggiatoa leptomitoformis]AUI70626.2 dipeptide ABC transporter ATP-binding protein [Beggiatoa leptomitoformis]